MASNRRSRNIANGNRNFDRLNNSIDKLIDTIDKLQNALNNSSSRNSGNNPNSDRNRRNHDSRVDLSDLRKKMSNSSASQMRDIGRGMELIGQKMKSAGGATAKFSGLMKTAGKGLKTFGGVLGKVKGGLLIIVDLIGKAAKALADADKRQQDIQNRRNTLFTQRNIDLSNVEAEGTIDKINTAFQQQMSEYNKMIVEQKGLQDIANQTGLANASAQISGTIGNINQAAWERLSAQTDINAAYEKLQEDIIKTSDIEERRQKFVQGQYERGQESRAYQQRQTLLNTEVENAKLNTEAVRNTAENGISETVNRIAGGSTEADAVYNFDKNHTWDNTYGNKGTDAKHSRFEDVNLSAKNAAAATAGIANSLTSLGGVDFGNITDAALTKSETTLSRDITNAVNNLNAQQANYENYAKITQDFEEKRVEVLDKQAEDTAEIRKSVIDTNAQIQKMYQKMAQTVEDWAMKFQDMSFNTGIGKGITDRRQLETFSSYINQMTTKLARTYGLTTQDVMQLIQGYSPGGRNMMMNESDLTKQAAFSKKYLGGDTQTAAELANNAELFNIGVSGTVDMFSDIAKKLNRMGLDGRKYMKDMVNNMKMANKFTFKGGVKGLADMAKWAQNVRFNMANVPQILDNIQSGGLENIITKAAKIQVLGGRYAMYTDPLAMYYEAFNDPDALMKRFNNMTKGMGRFNKKTGNVDFNQVDQELMRAFAEASGQSIEDVRAQATYNIKKNKVTGVNQNLTGDQQQALVNKAYYENGKWMVNTIDGRKMNVRDVNEQNVGMVQGETYEDTMEKGMAKLVSFTELFTGAQEGNLSQLSKVITDNGILAANMNERLAKENEDFNEKFEFYIGKVSDNMSAATEAYKNSLQQDAEAYKTTAKEVVDKIEEYGGAVVNILNDIYRGLGYENNAPTYQQFIKDEASYTANKDLPKGKEFAKTDGSFGTLFNGVFGRIVEIYNNLSNNSVVPSEPIGKAQFVSSDDAMAFGKGNPMTVSANEPANQIGINTTPTEITIKPVEVKLSGSVRLEANGQSIDLMELLNKNPMLIRQLSQMISDEVGKSINGGRSVTQYDYLRK